MTASWLWPSTPKHKWQHRLSSRTPTGTELASRQLIQSAYRNPVESNMQRNETKNKNKSPYERKNDEQTLTPVTCSWKADFSFCIRFHICVERF
jgi:phage protein D